MFDLWKHLLIDCDYIVIIVFFHTYSIFIFLYLKFSSVIVFDCGNHIQPFVKIELKHNFGGILLWSWPHKSEALFNFFQISKCSGNSLNISLCAHVKTTTKYLQLPLLVYSHVFLSLFCLIHVKAHQYEATSNLSEKTGTASFNFL